MGDYDYRPRHDGTGHTPRRPAEARRQTRRRLPMRSNTHGPDVAHDALVELSTTALHLHLCSVLVTATTDRPGFVSDEFLATVDEDLTLALMEVCLIGLWQRDEGGYLIPPRQLQQVIVILDELADES